MNIYLDNAATTQLDKEVLEAMLPYMNNLCGNPSSIHSYGRKAKAAVEKVRKQIATLLRAAPAEIFFTSGGTEGNNMVLRGAIEGLGINHVITSPIEHWAVLQPLAHMDKAGQIQRHYVEIDTQGNIRYEHLEHLLKSHPRALVSLMHGNNEIGNLNDLVRIGMLCRQYQAVFHTDAVQTLGRYPLDLQALPIDLLVGSAHKLHGPQGTGLVYINSTVRLTPLVHGGPQEQGMRGGTENVPGIIGFGKAIEVAYRDMEAQRQYIQHLKQYMISSLQATISGVAFHGTSADLARSLYTLLSVDLPPGDNHDMLLFNLDIQQIAASAGSACTSGSQQASHVIEALQADPKRGTVRFSLSKYNTVEEIDHTVKKLAVLFPEPA
ncbi:MAG: cysteine desulfurase family protein [Bacteroidota bacterium]